MPQRIAMWSGPRNISTALMRSFSSRPDCFVTDEPLYAHYLAATNADHPAREHVIAAHEPDWRNVAAFLTGPIPRGRSVWYQKHMAHHLTPDVDRAWLAGLTNALLVRDPAEMITSYIKVLPNPTPEDLGLPQQVALFDWLRETTGHTPPVVDSRDILEDPRGVLGALCERLGIAFDAAMLSWEPGPRDTDGVWAPHWYEAVEKSTAFAPYRPKHEVVPERLSGVLRECEALYARLSDHRVTT
ncbi:MAG: hypothetical protein R3B68_09395 [Phycisphaerales bacterium]